VEKSPGPITLTDVERYLRRMARLELGPDYQGVGIDFPAMAAALLFFSGAGGSNANLTTLLLASGVVGIASALYRLRWGFKPRRSHRRETPSAPG
jgi:hypothetical protein